MKIITAMIIACSLFLVGCATTTGQERALVLQKCPVLKTYSKEEMRQAAKELRILPDDSRIAGMITDYGQLRDACRVAERKLKQIRKKPKYRPVS